MNIGKASETSGLPVKTIRYYEEIELIAPQRLENGYRDFSAVDVQDLKFLRRARDLGFSIDECRMLLELQRDPARASSQVKSIANGKIIDIDRQIVELQSLRATLSALVSECRGDDTSECAILEGLAH
ncbi:MAG: MerR family DNA-binding protein [Rhodobacteraceae bacterium]|nr:MerR family DNA-binding protein [Paracoccaceae bacterium]